MATLKNDEDESGDKRRGTYSRTERTRIGNYAVAHGTSAALNHFITKFQGLKYTTICEWKKAIIEISKKDQITNPRSQEGKTINVTRRDTIYA